MEEFLNEKANATIASTNATAILNLLHELRRSNKGALAKIEVYVCLTASVLALVVIMGSLRRRFGHQRLFTLCIWFSSTVSFGLISYTMGLMTAGLVHQQLFAIWAVFLLLALSRADSLTAYHLEDHEKRSWFAWKMVLQMFWAGWLIGSYVDGPIFQGPLWCLWFVILMRNYEKIKAHEYASRHFGPDKGMKLVADFMNYEPQLSTSFDPKSMKGYHYLVCGEEQAKTLPGEHLNMGEVVTIQDVWDCKGRLLGPDGDPECKLKDFCLSFALFKLLRRRFSRHQLYEAHLEKTKAFVRDGLLRNEQVGDAYKRVLRVTEVELAFLYDFFYTKYPVIFARGFPVHKIVELLVVFIGSCFAASSIGHYQTAKHNVKLVVFGFNIDLYVTRAIIIVIIIMEIYQFIAELLCDWHKVTLLSNYVKKSSWQKRWVEQMIKWFCRRTLVSRFERNIGQYSFLESFDYNPPTIILNRFLSKLVNLRKEGEWYHRIQYPEVATRAVIKFLSSVLDNRDQYLTNGEGSLLRNSTKDGGRMDYQLVPEFLEQCQCETHIHGIMVWHIATCLCEYEYDKKHKNPNVDETLKNHFTTASCLSKYIAYLAVHVPALIPDHVEVTNRNFNDTVKDARNLIGRGRPLEHKWKKMVEEDLTEHIVPQNSIVRRGAKLGSLLLRDVIEPTVLWKVLADFWVEKLVFLAPSDNATGHAESLTKGGEFITCLWALLNHAGIVEPNTHMANNPVEIPIESDQIPLQIDV